MRITLTDIHSSAAQTLCVSFTCACGKGRGQWLGPPPQVAQDYEVELSLEDELRWNHNIGPSPEGQPRIDWDQGALQISGHLLQVDDDGGAALAIGQSIVLLSVQDVAQCTPLFVKLLARQVSLRPIEL
ncbi:hypothetical protein GV819_32285 [Pseudomonas sp. Fl5BN2]|uniref:hypothetical protein n=1 Tax=Pseudomonas sp. Fl5BN2 TaxID=2697652 RepID=UPI001377B7EE|nr:hypothetical protein [Pseudomonas sp. Fl5BN2]NBF06953.1 hypothetical protein [Pseudomonas sp. Fl5BN2]